MSKGYPHIPVMLEEVLRAFAPLSLTYFYEGTVGAGGHAEALLKMHPEIEGYLACDRDQTALRLAQERLDPWKNKLTFIHDNFTHLDRHLKQQQIAGVDGFFLI